MNGGLRTVMFDKPVSGPGDAETTTQIALQARCSVALPGLSSLNDDGDQVADDSSAIECAAAAYSPNLSSAIPHSIVGPLMAAEAQERVQSDGGVDAGGDSRPGYGCEAVRRAPPSAGDGSGGGGAVLVPLRGGGCSFVDKARVATAAGYQGLVIVNSPSDAPSPSGLFPPGLGDEDDLSLPVVMVPYDALGRIFTPNKQSQSQRQSQSQSQSRIQVEFYGGGLGSSIAEDLFYFGDYLRKQGDLRAAVPHYARAAALEPRHQDAVYQWANALYTLNETTDHDNARRVLSESGIASHFDREHFDREVRASLVAAARRVKDLARRARRGEPGGETGTRRANQTDRSGALGGDGESKPRVRVLAVATSYKPQLEMLRGMSPTSLSPTTLLPYHHTTNELDLSPRRVCVGAGQRVDVDHSRRRPRLCWHVRCARRAQDGATARVVGGGAARGRWERAEEHRFGAVRRRVRRGAAARHGR